MERSEKPELGGNDGEQLNGSAQLIEYRDFLQIFEFLQLKGLKGLDHSRQIQHKSNFQLYDYYETDIRGQYYIDKHSKFCEHLFQLEHPNLLKLHYYSRVFAAQWIGDPYCKFFQIFQYCESSLESIMAHMERQGQSFKKIELSVIIESIARALDFLHKQNIIHNNLLPSQIMINPRGEYQVLPPQIGMREKSEFYPVSPEQYHNQYFISALEQSEINPIKAEMFSFGMLILRIGMQKPFKEAYGKFQFDRDEINDALQQFFQKHGYHLGVIVSQLLDDDPQQRPDAYDVYQNLLYSQELQQMQREGKEIIKFKSTQQNNSPNRLKKTGSTSLVLQKSKSSSSIVLPDIHSDKIGKSQFGPKTHQNPKNSINGREQNAGMQINENSEGSSSPKQSNMKLKLNEINLLSGQTPQSSQFLSQREDQTNRGQEQTMKNRNSRNFIGGSNFTMQEQTPGSDFSGRSPELIPPPLLLKQRNQQDDDHGGDQNFTSKYDEVLIIQEISKTKNLNENLKLIQENIAGQSEIEEEGQQDLIYKILPQQYQDEIDKQINERIKEVEANIKPVYLKKGHRYQGYSWQRDREIQGEDPIPHEFGVYWWANGDRFEGNFYRGKYHGIGIYYWANGNQHYGEFIKGQIDGLGVRFYNDGDMYFGEWKKGLNHGKGTFYWSSLAQYQGQFFKDQIYGQGTLITNDVSDERSVGRNYNGMWKDQNNSGISVEEFDFQSNSAHLQIRTSKVFPKENKLKKKIWK